MSIDYSKLRGITARQLAKALKKDGFDLIRTKGSHQQYRHPEDKRRVTVSGHKPGATLPIGTLKRMIEEEAQWTEEDLRRLKLLK